MGSQTEVKEQRDVKSSIKGRIKPPHDDPHVQQTSTSTQCSSDAIPRLAGEEEEVDGRWARLHTRLSEKLSALKRIQEEDLAGNSLGDVAVKDKDPGLMTEDAGFVALQELQKCTATVKQLRSRDRSVATGASSGGGSPPKPENQLYRALDEMVHPLDTITDLLLSPMGTTADHAQLSLLLLECISAELVVLEDEVRGVMSEVHPSVSSEEPEALRCLTELDGCLQAAQSVLLSSQNRLHTSLGHAPPNQAGPEDQENRPFVFEEVTDELSHPSMKDLPSLECMLVSQWRKSSEDTTEMQRVSQALLQGLGSLVDLGQERLAHSQNQPVGSRSQLQTLVCRHKKFFRVLGSRLAFGQRLFQREPQGALQGLEDEWVRLESQAKSLQLQALEQGVTLQKKLQDWGQWEVGCERMGRLLEELEGLIPSGDPEEEETEHQLQGRTDVCQRVLVLLRESRPTLGWILDMGKGLHTGGCSTQVTQAGGALELRWRCVRSKAEQESKRSRDIRDNWARFCEDSVALAGWTDSAVQRLESLRSSMGPATPADTELKTTHLARLLDFSVELEARSAQKASALRAGTSLLQLKEADAPALRSRLAQLEQSWSTVTSALPATQERLHQLLLDRWPPQEALLDLETWASELEAKLGEVSEGTLAACHATQLTHILQHYQELKAGMTSGQLTLDFLSQSGPQAALSEVGRSERTLLAERLGDLNMHWLLLQGRLDAQVRVFVRWRRREL